LCLLFKKLDYGRTIRLIAERLKGLREVLNISIPEAAKYAALKKKNI
jgi:hypothetical protein